MQTCAAVLLLYASILEHADSMRVGSPIARPGAVICISMNDAAHAAIGDDTSPIQETMRLSPRRAWRRAVAMP